MKFADKIMLLRSKRSISQKELAKALNVSRQSVYKWEADLSTPEIDKIKGIAEFFGISYEELLNDNVALSFDNLMPNKENTSKDDTVISKKTTSKKLLLIMLALVAFVVIISSTIIIIALVNRNNDSNNNKPNIPSEHTTHDIYMTSIIKEATCEEEGSINIACTECDYKGISTLNKKDHKYVDGICLNCNTIEGTVGIEYAYSEELNGYYVRSIGTCIENDIVITNKYNGKEVASIGKEAFAGSHINSVKIPDTVRIIEEKAFYQCASLSEIELGNGITKIGEYAFSKCSTINSVIIPNSTKVIEKYAFEESNIDYLLFGTGIEAIKIGAFHNSLILGAEFSEDCKWVLKSTADKEILEIQAKAYSDAEIVASMLYESWGCNWFKEQ